MRLATQGLILAERHGYGQLTIPQPSCTVLKVCNDQTDHWSESSIKNKRFFNPSDRVVRTFLPGPSDFHGPGKVFVKTEQAFKMLFHTAEAQARNTGLL